MWAVIAAHTHSRTHAHKRARVLAPFCFSNVQYNGRYTVARCHCQLHFHFHFRSRFHLFFVKLKPEIAGLNATNFLSTA